jgi:hypothetical protein
MEGVTAEDGGSRMEDRRRDCLAARRSRVPSRSTLDAPPGPPLRRGGGYGCRIRHGAWQREFARVPVIP